MFYRLYKVHAKPGSQTPGPRRPFVRPAKAFWEFSNNYNLRCLVPWKNAAK